MSNLDISLNTGSKADLNQELVVLRNIVKNVKVDKLTPETFALLLKHLIEHGTFSLVQETTGFKGTLSEYIESVKGVKGDKGEPGEKGEQGLKGEMGPQGPQGTKGQQGERGLKGEQGDKGDTGLSAYQIAYENGFRGTQKQWLESLKVVTLADGTTPVAGPMGEKGLDGKPGKDGEHGKSAYELAKEEGFDGSLTEWLESLKSTVEGPQGPAGAKGEDGKDGEQGPEGAPGERGPEGLQGPQGDIGPAGPQGIPGNDGSPGQDGANGKSAYELYVEVQQGKGVAEDDILSLEAWLESLKGAKGEQGDPGPEGPLGLPGRDAEQTIHSQEEESDVWVVNHNLNKYPMIVVLDEQGNLKTIGSELLSIQYTDMDNILVTFASATKGKVILQ